MTVFADILEEVPVQRHLRDPDVLRSQPYFVMDYVSRMIMAAFTEPAVD